MTAIQSRYERITKENEGLHLLEETIKSLNNIHSSHLSSVSTCCNCSGELSVLMKHTFESEKSSHPGFVISLENLDIQLQRENMSMESQNRDYHWVNHQLLESLGLISDRKDQMQTWRKFQTSNFFLLLMPNSNNGPTTLYLLHGSWLTTLMLWLLWSMHESFISPTNTQMRWLRSPRRYFSFFICKSII